MKKYKFTELTNRKTIDTKHSLERYVLRYQDLFDKDKLNNMISEVKDKIIIEYDDKAGQYGWHSKSTGAGGIIDWRPDFMSFKDKMNHAIIVTNFPVKKQHTFKNVDAVIIIEQQVMLWAKEKGFKKIKMNEGLCELFSEEYENQKFYVTFFEGKLYDFKLDGYILVD